MIRAFFIGFRMGQNTYDFQKAIDLLKQVEYQKIGVEIQRLEIEKRELEKQKIALEEMFKSELENTKISDIFRSPYLISQETLVSIGLHYKIQLKSKQHSLVSIKDLQARIKNKYPNANSCSIKRVFEDSGEYSICFYYDIDAPYVHFTESEKIYQLSDTFLDRIVLDNPKEEDFLKSCRDEIALMIAWCSFGPTFRKSPLTQTFIEATIQDIEICENFSTLEKQIHPFFVSLTCKEVPVLSKKYPFPKGVLNPLFHALGLNQGVSTVIRWDLQKALIEATPEIKGLSIFYELEPDLNSINVFLHRNW
jgi:hypothetical protein